MADNDRFKIIKIENMCKNCLQARDTCMQVCEPEKGLKTRAEYEDIIFQLAKQAVTAEGLAKDICDRLFGEGE